MSKQPLTNDEGEVRELDAEDFRAFRPASEVLPPELAVGFPKRLPRDRELQKNRTTERITMRLDADVIEAFRAQGPDWQARINEALKRALLSHR